VSRAKETAIEQLHKVLRTIEDILQAGENSSDDQTRETLRILVQDADETIKEVLDQLTNWCSPDLILGGKDDFN
jgi:hypothetical protein